MVDTKANLWKSGREEGVEVDQQALIDKILARYAGEFTVFRELLQNSDDASAKIVEIHFHTQAHLDRINTGTTTSETTTPFPDLKTQPFVQWVFQHDGIPFKNADWDRLRKIAEGNPDEEKIGAFGVGFYSLFSITDEPFVKSGKQWMGFYWRNSQLVARRGKLPFSMGNARSGSPWTSFDMPLRQHAPFSGNYLDFTRFIATSLTFVKHIKDISVFIDDHRVARVQKGVERPKQLTIPEYFNRKTPLEMMKVKEIHTNEFHLTARIMRWILQCKVEKGSAKSHQSESAAPSNGPASNLLDVLVSSIVLTVYSAQVSVRLEKNLAQELLRATKKKSPKTCTYSLIYIEKDDTSDKENSVFRGLRADLRAQGTARIFIGHATSQSTGMGGHVSARFLPTVERESVDLVDQHVSKWNKELLYVGGLLARFIYDMEISQIRDSWEQAANEIGPGNIMNKAIAKQLDTRGTRILQFFSFYPTTPSQMIGKELEAAFFSSVQDQEFFVVSNVGVQSARQVRFHNSTIKAFTKNIPMISYSGVLRSSAIVNVLRERGMLQDVTVEEVLDNISQRPLSEEEMVKCLEWRITQETRELSSHDKVLIRERFLQETLFYLPPKEDGRAAGGELVQLSSIKTFTSSINAIPQTCPLPPHTIPFSIGGHFQPRTLQSVFGWNELGIVDWVMHLIIPSTLNTLQENVTTSATFAEEVLNIIASNWTTLPETEKKRLKTALKDKTIIPTTTGMMKPKESYFPFVDQFEDLPIVCLPSGADIEDTLSDLLSYLDVRKHVEMDIIINRRILTGNWDMMAFMDYLVTNRNLLPPTEIETLGKRAAFMPEPRASIYSVHKKTRVLLSELYEPSDIFRELGLPVLDWRANTWQKRSEEAQLLCSLGLKSYPDLTTLVKLMASPKEKIREAAMKYFLNNFGLYSSKYNASAFGYLKYIPAVRPDGTIFMSKPSDVYADSECAVMGFSVIDPKLRDVALTKLGIQKHPPTRLIMNVLLETPPTQLEIAQKYFEYLASRIADFSGTDYDALRQACIIPATPPVGSLLAQAVPPLLMAKPGECIFKLKGQGPTIHEKLFVFVDFGTKANIFLKACGVKDRPEMKDIIKLLLRDPKHFLELVGTTDEYLEQLRKVSAYKECPHDLIEQMWTSPFLLGRLKSDRSPNGPGTSGLGVDCKGDGAIFELLQPSQIAILDDINAYSLFSDSVHVAPLDETLEAFYLHLGSPRLTTLITEECEPEDIVTSNSPLTTEIKNLIIQRSVLFLHDPSTLAKVKPEWLLQMKSFTVRCCENLKLNRVLRFRGRRIPKIQTVSARTITADGEITLWVSKNGELDMYEVANTMCKVLLNDPRPNDSLLFMTMLTTDLDALRRRGYDVDRILDKLPVPQDATLAEASKQEPNLVLMVPTLGAQPVSTHLRETNSSKQTVNPRTHPYTRLRNPGAILLLPTGNLDSSIQITIDDSSPENKEGRETWEQIKKIGGDIGDSYCNVECSGDYLESQGTVSGYQFYVSHDGLNSGDIQTQKQEVIARFVTYIINPLAAIFSATTSTLNILHDSTHDVAGFNEGGQVFLSLNFYEQWHDEDVINGSTRDALTTWYYTLAHQIAHNSARHHDAEHVSHFAAICERHFPELLELLINAEN